MIRMNPTYEANFEISREAVLGHLENMGIQSYQT